jgi:hypothetical protein
MTEQVQELNQQAQSQPAQPEMPPAAPQTIAITGKQLSAVKRQLLNNLTNQYQNFMRVIAVTYAEEDTRNDAVEFFDRGYLRMQEAIIALKVINVPQFQAPAEPQAAQETQGTPETTAQPQVEASPESATEAA